MKLPGRVVMAGVVAAGLIGTMSCSEDAGPTQPDPEPGSVRATVLGDGSALAGATVRLFADGGATALTSGTSNASGQVTFAGLAPGAYDVEVVVVPGFELSAGEVARKDVTVASNATATVTFALAEVVVGPTVGQLRVRVADGATGVAGVEVDLLPSSGGMPLATGTTGADGRFLFGDLDPGSYGVEITLPPGHTIAPGDTTRKSATVTAGATADVTFSVDAPTPTLVEVTVAGTSFTPSDVTIAPGGTVRWIWGGGSHTVTPSGHTQWSSRVMDGASDTLTVVFNSAGTFDYFCIPHQSLGMTGVVRVQ